MFQFVSTPLVLALAITEKSLSVLSLHLSDAYIDELLSETSPG